MIDYYDQLQESVKMREAVIRGKAKSTQKLSTLSMRVILQKNKEIKHVKKQQLSRVIESRKLRIKVSQVLNIKNPSLIQSAVSAQLSRKNSIIKKPAELMIKTAKMHTSNKLLKTNVFMSERKSQRSYLRLLSQESNIQEDGRINLFDNFTQEQLDRIQENQAYYLTRPDLIPIFRKYMHRKRQNNKDFSYDNFTIKPNQSMALLQDSDPNFDKKRYILNKLNINDRKKTVDNELHLLTNPIQFTTTSQKPRSKSQFQLSQNKKNIINMLKDKQAQNKQRLIAEQNKKILGFRINRNYFDGLAAEKRAQQKDRMHEYVANKNKIHDEKSITCRKRIKTLKEDIGKSVEMAEIVRLELLKRRTTYRKKA